MHRHPAKLEDITRLLGQGKIQEALDLFEEVAQFKPRPKLEVGDLVQVSKGGPWYEVTAWAGADIYWTGDVKRSLERTLAINRQGFIWRRRGH